MSGPRHWSRRGVLGAGLGLGAWSACRPSLPPLQGEILGDHRAERGHRLRQPQPSPKAGATESIPEKVPLCIVGAGIAGLSAAWRLRRGGFDRPILILELDDNPGGTSQSGSSPIGPHALGAHYITLPNPDNHHCIEILKDLGIILDFQNGKPRFDPLAHCLAPQERVWVAGRWLEDLWPSDGAAPWEESERSDFEAYVAELTNLKGADDRFAFNLPLALSSVDPRFRELSDQSMADWFAARGYRSERLRWMLEYACKDDYGANLHTTSAWAGLHYHACRRPDPADAQDLGTAVLTWPAGNGHLAHGLLRLARADLRTGVVVRQIEAETGRIWAEQGDRSIEIHAERVLLAVPATIAGILLNKPDALAPQAAAWRIALLHLDHTPTGEGVPSAWDSVLYGPTDNPDGDLGVIDNSWQNAHYGGPTVLTWYQPLTDADPRAARARLAAMTWEETVDTVLTRLSVGWPDLRQHVHRIDLWRWGHGTIIPGLGLHRDPQSIATRSRPEGRVFRAHTDQSGLSLFEEASWQGVRAAEEMLRSLGIGIERSFLDSRTPADWIWRP